MARVRSLQIDVGSSIVARPINLWKFDLAHITISLCGLKTGMLAVTFCRDLRAWQLLVCAYKMHMRSDS